MSIDYDAIRKRLRSGETAADTTESAAAADSETKSVVTDPTPKGINYDAIRARLNAKTAQTRTTTTPTTTPTLQLPTVEKTNGLSIPDNAKDSFKEYTTGEALADARKTFGIAEKPTYSTDDVSGNWSRYLELANKSDVLTSDEKAEAKAGVSALKKAATELRGGFWQNGSTEDKQTANNYDALRAVLESKTSAGGSFASGLISGILPGASKIIGKSKEESQDADLLKSLGYSDDVIGVIRGNNAYENAAEANPVAATAGELTGSVLMLTGVGKAVEGVTSGIKTFTQLSKATQNAINTAATIGAVSGAYTAADQTWSKAKWDAEQEAARQQYEAAGIDYTPVSYSAWRNIGNVARSTVASALGGYLGGLAANAVGGKVLSLIEKSALSPIAKAAIAYGSGGLAFAGTLTATQELEKAATAEINGTVYKPDVAGIAKNIVVMTVFSALAGIARQGFTYKTSTSAENNATMRQYFTKAELNDMEALQKRYRAYSKEYADVRNSVDPDPARVEELSKITNAYNLAKANLAQTVSEQIKTEAKAANESGEPMDTESAAVKQAIALLNEADLSADAAAAAEGVRAAAPAETTEAAKLADVETMRTEHNERAEALNQQIADLEAHPELLTDEVLQSIEAESTALAELRDRIDQLAEAAKPEGKPKKELKLPGTEKMNELPSLIGGENGGEINGTAIETAGSGTDALGDGQGRIPGAGTGKQAGSLESGARQEPQSIAARRRQDILDARGIGAVSAREIGLQGGSEDAILKVLPDDVVAEDRELSRGKSDAADLGYEIHYYIGMASVYGVNIEGWTDGSDVWIQADRSGEKSRAGKIAEHEIFHAEAANDPGRISAVARELLDKYGRPELENIISAYIEKYAGIVDLDDGSIDESTGFRQSDLYILEEIFADAVAGRNRFGKQAGKYQADVKRVTEERLPAKRETAKATARKTGPPEAASAAEEGKIILPGAEDVVEPRNMAKYSVTENKIDSEGNVLTPEQIEFFKDSQVRDQDGNLKVVYHHTNNKFTVFDRNRARTSMDIDGFFFAPENDPYNEYGDKVIKAYLNIKNPVINPKWQYGVTYDAGTQERLKLISEGYDGVFGIEDGEVYEYMAFDPEQIKLTTNKQPTADPDIRYSVAEEADYAPVFYSKAEQVVEAYKGDKIAAGSLESYLKGHGVKDEEIKWSGIAQWLEGKKSVAKDEVMEFLRANQLQIRDVIKNTGRKGGVEYRVSELTPFFQNISDEYSLGYDFAEDDDFVWRAAEYLTDDTPPDETDFIDYNEKGMYEEAYNSYDPDYYDDTNAAKYQAYKLPGGINYREVLFTLPNYSAYYKSQHWDERNVLAHTRLQDFIDAGGRKVLFIDEIQSDWHQMGRDDGYESELTETEKELPGWVPDAPYKTTWHEFVLKRILRMAAEGNYDVVAWTTGQMQSDRYDLTKYLSRIEYSKRPDGSYHVWAFDPEEKSINTASNGIPIAYADLGEVARVFGKDIANKMTDDSGVIGETGMTVGGKGMRDFYDIGGRSGQNIPRFLGKYVKQWGSRLQTIEIPDASDTDTYANMHAETRPGEPDAGEYKTVEVPAVDITPAMKRSVLYEGQPKYSVADEEDDNYALAGDTANYKPETLDVLFQNYSVNKSSTQIDYAQRYVAYISPDDFLNLTTTSEETRARIANTSRERYGEFDAGKMGDVRSAGSPYLTFDQETGEVIGHEGRHRMSLMKDAGINKVAITLHPYPNETGKYSRKKLDSLMLTGEEFSNGKSGAEVILEDVLPLSRRYESEVRATYGSPARVKYSAAEDEEDRGDAVTYDALVQKPDMELTRLTDDVPKLPDGRVDKNAVRNAAINNILEQDNPNNTERQKFVYIPDIDADVLVNTRGIRHGLARNTIATEATAKAEMHLGDILANAIKVNELEPREGGMLYSHVLMGFGTDAAGNLYPVRAIINHTAGDRAPTAEITVFDILEGVKVKRREAGSAHKLRLPEGGLRHLTESASTISISDMLDIVKDAYPDTLSNNVLEHFGIERPSSSLSPYVRYSVAGDEQGIPSRKDIQKAEAQAKKDIQKAAAAAFSIRGTKRVSNILEFTLSKVARGEVKQADLDDTFEALFDAGEVYDNSETAQEFRNVAEEIQGRRIYVSPQAKLEFGEDWNSVRTKAFGNKVYFTNNPKDLPLDSSNAELASSYPGFFDATETDPAGMIQSMINIWDNTKSHLISIEDEARKFGGEAAVRGYRNELKAKFMKMIADYDQKVNGAKAARTEALQAAKDAGEKKISEYIELARQKMRERAEQALPTPTPVRFYADEGMSYEDYVAMIEAKAKDARAARLRTVPKEAFAGTPMMEKYGVRIEGSVTDYRNVDQLRENNKAVRSVKKALRKTEERLKATDKERKFASGIASGYYTEADIPATMDSDKVMELADFYMAERAIGTSLIMQRRFDIYRALDEKVYADWSDSEEYSPAKFGKLSKMIMNERQPERVLMSIYGRDKGGKLFRDYFWPVETNEAGRLRFINSVLDRVRTFEDKTGRERALTPEEDALAQKVKEGRAVGEIVAAMEMKRGIHNAAENLRKTEIYKKAEQEGLTKKDRDAIDKALGREIADQAQEFGLGTEERNLVRHYARWLETQDELEKADGVIIDNAVKVYDEIYDDFYEMINQLLVAHGYEPIGFIKGYAPHMQTARTQESILEAFKALGVNTDIASALPTSIAGETVNFKPNMRYNPYFQTRTGDFTHYSITQGLESYISYMSDVIFHVDDIMRDRRVEKYLRSTYAPEELSDQIELANGLRYAPAEIKAAYLQNAGAIEHSSMLSANDVNDVMEGYIEDLYTKITNVSKYGEFTTWLNNYINIQAGKQSLADRGLEYNGGRAFLNLGNKIMRLFAQRNVGGNLASMINQFAQLPLVSSHLGGKYVGRALVDLATGEIRRGDFMERSDFLTGKEGINWVTQDGYDKFINALFAPMTLTDTLLSTIAVRGEYLRLLDRGYSDADALKGADAFGRRVMGSRMKGVKPQGFESKSFVQQMIHVFQVEASNTFDYTFVSTLPNEIKDTFKNEGKAAGFKKLAAMIVGYLLTAFIMNRITDALYGGTPAPYDLIGLTSIFIASGKGLTPNTWIRTVIDNGWEKMAGERLFDTEPMDPERKFEWGDAWDDLTWNATNDIPYIGNLIGLAGMGDKSLPTVGINEAWADIKAIWPSLTDTTDEDGTVLAPDWWAVVKHLVSAVSQIAAGGRQANKTLQGAEIMLRGGKYSGTGDSKRLIYPVEQTIGNWLQALIFGPSALDETAAYYAGDDNGLTARQTKAYEELKDDGVAIEDILAIDDKWNEIGKEDMSAVEKATALAKWVDEQGYTEEQAGLIKNSWVYTSGFVAQAEGYEKYRDAGMDEDAAYEVAAAILALDPLPGETGVKDSQRYEAILGLDLSKKEKIAAMGVVMGTDTKAYEKFVEAVDAGISLEDYAEIRQQDYAVDRYLKFIESGTTSNTAVTLAEDIAKLKPEELDENGEGTVSDLQRYRAVVDSGVDMDEQVSALGALMQDAEYAKITTAYDYGVSPKMYVTVKENIKAIDENGSTTQAEAKTAIDQIPGLSTTERATLWQIVNKSWSAAGNPYNSGVGAKVRAELQGATETTIEKNSGGLSLPGLGGNDEKTAVTENDGRLKLPGLD